MKTKLIQSAKGYLRSIYGSPERAYLLLALVFGFVFVVITPAFFNADEMNHFYRAYQLSDGDLLPEMVHGYAGGTIPASLVKSAALAPVANLSIPRAKEPKLNRAQWKVRLDAKVGKQMLFPNTALNSPIVYLPQIVAIEVLKPFNPPPVLMLYAGRLAVLIVSALLLFYAIKLIPFGKWAVVAIGLLPMTVTVFASFAADGITIGLSILLVAYILHLAYSKLPLDKRQLASLGMLLVGVGLAKSTYIVLAALVFVIPLINVRFRTRRYYGIFSGLMLLGFVFALAWQHATNYITSITIGGPADAKAQLHYILHHPFWYVGGPFLRTMVTNNSDGIIESLIGFFASLTTPLPYLYVLMSVFTLGFSYLAVSPAELKKRFPISSMTRWFVALIGLALTGAIATALYLYWSSVGEHIIEGLQGRYFIPLLVLGVICFSTKRVVVDALFRAKLILGSSSFVLLVTVFVCFAKFYSLRALI